MCKTFGKRTFCSLFVLTTCLLLVGPRLVCAQGLVWNLPESGTAVKYAGEYRQVTFRPQSEKGDLSFTWQRTFEIRCLNREMAAYEGKDVSCVWLEYEVATGQ